MCVIHKEYRREYLSELCERIIPLLEDELKEDDSKPIQGAVADLKIRLGLCADRFRQCKREQVEPKQEQEEIRDDSDSSRRKG